MNETMTSKMSLTSRIQQDYRSALEKSSNVIGLDPHEVLYKREEVVNILTHDDCCDFLQSAAHISMLNILKGVNSNLFNPDEIKAYINNIRSQVEKYDPKEATNRLVFPEPRKKDSKAPRINGRIILENFQYSFNKELCNTYDSFVNQNRQKTN